MLKSSFDCVVIGGGAAGMFAAITAAKQGKQVALIEKNTRLGKKLSITGKGRCNLTNYCDVETLFKNIPQNPKFLMSAFSRFSSSDTMDFFKQNGVALKVERGNRVFPVSDRAADVCKCLEVLCKKYHVQILHASAEHLLVNAQKEIEGVQTSAGVMKCKTCILATGGLSYPGTGSTGDGFRMAQELGHSISPLRPSLVPLTSSDPICHALTGLSLKNVSLRVLEAQKCIFEDLGEMLFSHFGLTGPMILSASAHIRYIDKKPYTCIIDLKPGLTLEMLDKRILRDFEKYINRDLVNALTDLLPLRMIPVVLEAANIPQHTKVHAVTRQQRERLCSVIKNLSIKVSGFRPLAEAIITRGGISTREINPKTMESKLAKNLYFAGEIIDVDAYTGGFNLQIAWSTAFVAGSSVGAE